MLRNYLLAPSNFLDVTRRQELGQRGLRERRQTGVLVNGGVEFRLHAVLAVAADVQYSHVPGILGQAGVSQQAGESDLGGVAARLKIVIGR